MAVGGKDGSGGTAGNAGDTEAGDGGTGDSAGRPGSAGAPAGAGGAGATAGRGAGGMATNSGRGGQATSGSSGGPSVAGKGGGAGMGGHTTVTGSMGGSELGGMSGSGGAAPATRSLLGCGLSPVAANCPTDTYLWTCPDTAKPVGKYEDLVGNRPDAACVPSYDDRSWCCAVDCILDTRSDAGPCPPSERPFQCNGFEDGQPVCSGPI